MVIAPPHLLQRAYVMSRNSGKCFEHLGEYSDLVLAANRSCKVSPKAKPGKATQRKLLETLSFNPGPAKPQSVRTEQRWSKNGVDGELVTWSVGYGPRTEAYVLKPAGVKRQLPAVVGLHDHGGFKFYGKEKIADGPGRAPGIIGPFRKRYYAQRAYANELAKQGYVVLVPDVFLWGSRRFDKQTLLAAGIDQQTPKSGTRSAVIQYNELCIPHEHLVEKYCTLLGTTFAGVVNYEDRVATAYLKGRNDVKSNRIGCVGLSGGGMRSTLLQGTSNDIRAAVIVGAMTTYQDLYDHNVVCHTWMVFPSNWPKYGDWPDIAACRAPSPVMVQNDMEDPLYTTQGMRAADRRMAWHYNAVGARKNYVCKFYPGPHKFDLPMQADAFAFLDQHLQP